MLSFLLPCLFLAATALAENLPECGLAKRVNCVVDGDTLWLNGDKIRIVGLDSPETGQAQCAAERSLGDAARRRLVELLGQGTVRLSRDGPDLDRYGRLLRVVEVDGRDVSAVLIREGLARPWTGKRQPWC